AGNPYALRPRITEVQFFGETVLEDIEMRGQRDVRLHDVQSVDLLRRAARKFASQEIGMLLVVAFDANAVARLDHGLHESNRIPMRDDLAAGDCIAARDPGAIALLELGPVANWLSWHGRLIQGLSCLLRKKRTAAHRERDRQADCSAFAATPV